MRRSILLGMLALLLAFPTAALADTTEPPESGGPGSNTYHFINKGNGGFAVFTNLEWTDEAPAPGTYFATYVDFGSEVSADGGQSYSFSYVCVWSESFTIDEFDNWDWLSSVGGCADGAAISTSRNLSQARVQASIQVIDCLLWDEETWECLEEADLGTIEIDLSLAGTGPTYRYHGTGTGGEAGNYQYAYNGTGSHRSAIPTGTIEFNGDSLIAGATVAEGQLFSSRNGYVEVFIGQSSPGG